MTSENYSIYKQKLPHLPSPNKKKKKKKEGDERQEEENLMFQPFMWSPLEFGEDAYSCAE